MAGFLGVGSCSIDFSPLRAVHGEGVLEYFAESSYNFHKLAACEYRQEHSARSHPCRATKMAHMMHHDHNDAQDDHECGQP